MTLQLLDTFSGIGGFSLAASWCRFSDGSPAFETVGFVEIEPFPQQVLRKHWPDVPILADIRETNADTLRQRGIGRIDIVTGGVPCQPASLAGARKGNKDERWLWPEFLRLVRELRPLYVLAENPRGIASLEPDGMDWIRDELAAAGYQSEVVLLAASDVGASHQRERLWIVAYSESGETLSAKPGGLHAESTLQGAALAYSDRSGRGEQPGTEPGGEELASSECRCATVASAPFLSVVDVSGETGNVGGEGTGRRFGQHSAERVHVADDTISGERGLPDRKQDSRQSGGAESVDVDGARQRLPLFPPHRNDFRSWAAVASMDAAAMPCVEREILHLDDGLSIGLLRRRRSARNATLKALGNSIQPQCAYVILQAIAQLHEGRL